MSTPTRRRSSRRAGWSSATATSTALDGADFELYPGEILAVIGDNGAGKSTLIKALSGALHPDEGEIRLDGEPVHFQLAARRARGRASRPSTRTSPSPRRSTSPTNLFLGREQRARRARSGSVLRMLDKGAMRREADAAHRRAADRHPAR